MEQEHLQLEQSLLISLSRQETKDWLKQFAQPFRELMACYRCAAMEVETKFNVLNEELSLQYDRNPIETIKTRIKTMESIVDKLKRKALALTLENIETQLFDVAGVRVICSFPSDIYMLEEALLKQDDIRLIRRKDYITSPKENGYRSLHLIVEIPIFLHKQKRFMKVEVQFRTISMDWWASLEHKIRYKKDVIISPGVAAGLFECAEESARLDRKMEAIYNTVIHEVEQENK